jgi:hypothetical protein
VINLNERMQGCYSLNSSLKNNSQNNNSKKYITMKTKIISLLVIIAFAVVSCQKDEAEKPVVLQDVTFGIDIVDQTGFKSTPDCQVDENGDLLVPTVAEVEIDGVTYFVDVFYVDGKYYTQAFKLGVDDNPYTVTKFVLWTLNPTVDPVNAKIVMAAPEAASEYADFVSMTVPFDVTVGGFEKLEVAIEVICFLPSEYDKFGFIWFEITEIVVREFCFFGDICANGDPYFPATFVGSAYDDGNPIPVDMHAIYEIRVLDDEGDPYPAVGENIFSNSDDPTDPLCVQFPDLLRVTEESFQFELWVLVPPAFDYVYFATFDVVEDANGDWSILYNGVDALNDYNAVDFAIGSCSPFSDHVFPYPVTP